MPAAVAEISPLDLEPLSPELVLVSPPELAARARLLLPQYRFATPPTAGGESSTSLGFGFVAFCLVCLASTVGPFLLAIVARAHH